MRDIAQFSTNVTANFENNYDNMVEFNALALDAAHGVFDKYSHDETQTILRKQFNNIFHINFKEATPMKRHQAYRKYAADYFALIEDVITDKMNSGWNSSNAFFDEFVEDKNIAAGDKNEFYVEDTSLLTVSKWASDHHDVLRQKVMPGKAYQIDTQRYVIKVYVELEEFMLGKIDFAAMVDKMYKSIEQYRYAALFAAFMSADQNLPTDMMANITPAQATRDQIVEFIESVKAATGKNVILVGTNVAIHTLQNTVPYAGYSNEMKNEANQKGILSMWEGYTCLGLDRVNIAGTRTSVFSAADNRKIFVMPIGGDKPIKRVNEGEVTYWERGDNGNQFQDRTLEAQIEYAEGIGVIISDLFGEIFW